MPDRWKFPREGQAWASCQTCGQEYPASSVWLNPRFGWQCQYCWDGLIQPDQTRVPIFPYEGTRKTPAPVTNTLLEGTGATSAAGLEPTYTWPVRDRVTGLLYDLHVTPLWVDDDGRIVYNTTSVVTLTLITETDDFIFDALRMNNHWLLYVENGAVATWHGPFDGYILEGSCDFGESALECSVPVRDASTDLIYLVDFEADPPTLTEIFTEASVFDAVAINSGWFLVIAGATIFSTTNPGGNQFFANDCITITVDADTGDQTNPPPGGGGGGITPVPPIVVDCPDMEVTDLDVDFTAIPPVGAVVTNYHWDFGDGTMVDTGTTPTTSHSYATTGTYTVTLTVTATTGTGVSHGCSVLVMAPIECVIDQEFLTEFFDHPYCDTPEHFRTELFNT